MLKFHKSREMKGIGEPETVLGHYAGCMKQ